MKPFVKKKIAILGATSHIAKGLIAGFSHEVRHELHLFARSPDRTNEFMTGIGCDRGAVVAPFSKFGTDEYDVVINCVGVGDPGELKVTLSSIFDVTETFDKLVVDYLKVHADSLYISLSSGAVYGMEFTLPASESNPARFDVNRLESGACYGIAKLNAEARHRALPELNIIDLRVFGYFSRFIDLKTKYLLSEVISCVKAGKELVTGPVDIVRDYVHPRDLMSMVECCINKKDNNVYDVYSLQPVTKFEMLDYFVGTYNLRYRIEGEFGGNAITGSKDHYYSTNRRAAGIGYSPRFTSLDAIAEESRVIL